MTLNAGSSKGEKMQLDRIGKGNSKRCHHRDYSK